MRVLFVGQVKSPIYEYLVYREGTKDVGFTNYALPDPRVSLRGYRIIVSHNYKHLFSRDFLAECAAKRVRLVNCHISYLPWNRGSQPNFWSWFDGTPKGVSIHKITVGVDKGPLYAQTEVAMGDDETLATSHVKLNHAMEELFVDQWEYIRRSDDMLTKQPSGGTYHSRADFEAAKHILTAGWGTPVREIASQW